MKKHLLVLSGLCILLDACGKPESHAPASSRQSDSAQESKVIKVGIGIQNTTTNTVTGGIVIKELGLLNKFLPHTGKYQDVKYRIDWQNFTSGPPVTNAMVANKLQIGMMGDYPLIINGYTFQSNPDSKSYLVSLLAYNAEGSGNGVVVNKDSPYYRLEDLKGKSVSVPFGSAAHGMLLKVMQDHGWPDDYFKLSNQSPEVGSSNLQEHKIDAHADFVPFTELLPFRGYARKIFDGAETHVPTFHGVVVRQDFADKYPEVVTAYLRAMLAADAWVKANPQEAAEKIAQWTGTDKEVVYIFLGKGGIMTLDPTLKPQWLQTIHYDAGVLRRLGKIRNFDAKAWVNDTFIRRAYQESGLNYDQQLARMAGTPVSGQDTFCKRPIDKPREAGEIWVLGGKIQPYSSPECTLAAIKALQGQGKKIDVVYLFDHAMGIKLFADKAFYVVSKQPGGSAIEPFLLKDDAARYAAKTGGRVVDYREALSLARRS